MNDATVPDYDVLIVGAGFSGLCAAIRLSEEGRRSFLVLEKSHDVGGAWRENTYPGCACDVPSHLYSFSFAPNPRWTETYAPQREILDYLRNCADRYGVRRHLRFGAEVVSAELDEGRALWRVGLRDGTTLVARAVILGTGALSRPAIPSLPGLQRFEGRRFHSACWDHDFALDGKRVGVIGTGASAIQFVPAIAPRVGQLTLFQRTPPWVLPREERAFSAFERRLFELAPAVQRAHRAYIYWSHEAYVLGFAIAPKLMALPEREARAHLEAQVKDPELRAKLTPDYRAGCKRLLMSNDYYPALARPNAEVVTSGIREVTPGGLVTDDGREHALDAIIFGTGFHVTDLLPPIRIAGRGGRTLEDAWREGFEAYLGTTVSGFPGLYLLSGPNTGLGHTSMVFMIEAQMDYVMRLLRALEARGARLADVRPEAQRRFNDELARRLGKTIWASGCRSWYLDDRGKNSALWPGFTFEFWLRTRRLHTADYDFQRAA